MEGVGRPKLRVCACLCVCVFENALTRSRYSNEPNLWEGKVLRWPTSPTPSLATDNEGSQASSESNILLAANQVTNFDMRSLQRPYSQEQTHRTPQDKLCTTPKPIHTHLGSRGCGQTDRQKAAHSEHEAFPEAFQPPTP